MSGTPAVRTIVLASGGLRQRSAPRQAATPSDVQHAGATPNHPEYPAAHGSITSAMAEVFSAFLDTNRFNLVLHGFDPAGAPGNLDAVRTYRMAAALRDEVVNARVWAGFHYRFSGEAGVDLGRRIAKRALKDEFAPVRR